MEKRRHPKPENFLLAYATSKSTDGIESPYQRHLKNQLDAFTPLLR
jgi:hypothetical protein